MNAIRLLSAQHAVEDGSARQHGGRGRLVEMAPRVFRTLDSTGAYRDPGATDGRSTQFRNATVFIGNGRFWRQDALGTAAPQ